MQRRRSIGCSLSSSDTESYLSINSAHPRAVMKEEPVNYLKNFLVLALVALFLIAMRRRARPAE